MVLWGEGAQYFISIAAVISVFGALNGWILIQGQMPQAIAHDKLFPKVFAIKKSLNILAEGLRSLDSLSDFTLEQKPLLLFGDCKQEWIDQNAGHIDKRIENVAVGAYYFGNPKYNCDLISKTKQNRHIF